MLLLSRDFTTKSHVIWAFLLVDLATASMETYQNLPFFFFFLWAFLTLMILTKPGSSVKVSKNQNAKRSKTYYV